MISPDNTSADIIDTLEAQARQRARTEAAQAGAARRDDRAKAAADKARAADQAQAAGKAARNLSAFAQRCPAAAAWIAQTMGTFDFARSMHDAIARYGDLTPKQADAVNRCMARAAQPRQPAANLNESSVAALRDCFDRAAAQQCRSAKLRIALTRPDPANPRKTVCDAAFVVSAAPLHGKNPGALYVKDAPTDTYLGKVDATTFHPARECTPAAAGQFVALCADPATAALAYSRHFCRCSVCHAILSDPRSVAEGIGPVCRAKFGL